jgi:methylenetetrahydrofolate dehydrogenase (NADP+)/methenyltetrahydrofolate cyclohydrolase
MSASVIDGKAIGKAVRADVAVEVAHLREHGVVPGLTVVLVGENPASQVYVRMKGRACDEAGMKSEILRLPDTTTEDELLATIDRLNADPTVHGMLVQLPLPDHITEQKVLLRIDPRKDVDGFHPVNVGKLVLGDPSGFRPATPYGVQEMLLRSDVETSGSQVVIVGRSNIVGKPMANLLIQKGPAGNATVTVCHSRTKDIGAVTREADILIVAIGKAEFVTADMVKPGAVVIDVGINRVDDASKEKGYRLVGDVAYDEVAEVASAITPVPGGVGPMTIAMLLKNTLQAARVLHADELEVAGSR